MTETKIAEYLASNLILAGESDAQWFVEDKDTKAYFSFDHNEPETDEESIDFFESFQGSDNKHFTFNINYLLK